MKKLLKHLIFSLLATAVIFLLLEGCFWVANKKFVFTHSHIDPGIAGKDVFEYPDYIKDKDVFWRLDPAEKGINSLGFRERAIPEKKDTNVIRIICMGDSVTFGPAVRTPYPQRLSQLLSARYANKKIEVFNAGIPGYSSYQGLQLLKKDIVRLQPDIVIAYFGVNDAGYNTNGRPDKAQRMPPSFVISIFNAVRNTQIFKFGVKVAYAIQYPAQASNEKSVRRVDPLDYKANVLAMKSIVEQAGGKFLFITNPVWYDPVKNNVFTEGAYENPGPVQSFSVYSLFKEKEADGSVYFLNDTSPYYFHLTDEGLTVLAQNMLQFLVNNRWLE